MRSLLAACPTTMRIKGHHCWKSIDMAIHATGVPYCMISEMVELAGKYETSAAQMDERGRVDNTVVNLHVKPLLHKFGKLTDTNRFKANRGVIHVDAAAGTIGPMELNKVDQLKGISGPPRSDGELETLKRALDDLRAGFASLIVRCESTTESVMIGSSTSTTTTDSPTTDLSSHPSLTKREKLIHCAKCKLISSTKSDFKRCSRCKSTFYCSPTCQKQDWRMHKFICKPEEGEEWEERPVFVPHDERGEVRVIGAPGGPKSLTDIWEQMAREKKGGEEEEE